MITTENLLIILALVLFLLAGFGVVVHPRVNLVALGLACIAGWILITVLR